MLLNRFVRWCTGILTGICITLPGWIEVCRPATGPLSVWEVTLVRIFAKWVSHGQNVRVMATR